MAFHLTGVGDPCDLIEIKLIRAGIKNQMKKRNAPCVIVEELMFDAPAGHAKLHRHADGSIIAISFGCPCGCGAHHGGHFTGDGAWSFDGNMEKPTVIGSFGCYPSHRDASMSDGKYHWHGHLRAGVFEEC